MHTYTHSIPLAAAADRAEAAEAAALSAFFAAEDAACTVRDAADGAAIAAAVADGHAATLRTVAAASRAVRAMREALAAAGAIAAPSALDWSNLGAAADFARTALVWARDAADWHFTPAEIAAAPMGEGIVLADILLALANAQAAAARAAGGEL